MQRTIESSFATNASSSDAAPESAAKRRKLSEQTFVEVDLAHADASVLRRPATAAPSPTAPTKTPVASVNIAGANGAASVGSESGGELSASQAAQIDKNRIAALCKRMMSNITEPSWREILSPETTKDYFVNLVRFLDSEKSKKTILPPDNQIFTAFNACPFDSIKVVIIGQDPYHGQGQAHGLSFSVQPGVKVPPSLQNIYKELQTDITGFQAPSHGHLLSWAKQGVLLLNAVLTVEKSTPNSHQGMGWEKFTGAAIKAINDRLHGVVFLLWGNNAKQTAAGVSRAKHHILDSAHPSPYSATKFFGNHHFSKANELLAKQNKPPIDWNLPASPLPAAAKAAANSTPVEPKSPQMK